MATGLTSASTAAQTVSPQAYDRFAVLDGLRGLGALIVVVGHGWGDMRSGYPAVDFFFLHSGFVLAYTNARRQHLPRFGVEFVVRRIIRIYPLYLIGLLLGLVEALHLMAEQDPLWSPHRLIFALVTGLFLVPDFKGGVNGAFPINQPGWSLFFELGINVVFAFTRFRLRPAVLICAASLPFLIFSYTLWIDGGGSAPGDFLGGFPRIGYSFCAGVIIFHALEAGRIPKLNAPWWLCWLALPLLYAPAGDRQGLYIPFLTILIQPCLAVIFTTSRISGRARGLALWLGLVSYALYCVHLPMQALCGWSMTSLHLMSDADSDTYAWLVSAPLSLLLAHVLTLYVDVPIRTALNAAWVRASASLFPAVSPLQTPVRTGPP